MIHAGTSVPSGETALNGSGSASVPSAANAAPTSVSRRSPPPTPAGAAGGGPLGAGVSPARGGGRGGRLAGRERAADQVEPGKTADGGDPLGGARPVDGHGVD